METAWTAVRPGNAGGKSTAGRGGARLRWLCLGTVAAALGLAGGAGLRAQRPEETGVATGASGQAASAGTPSGGADSIHSIGSSAAIVGLPPRARLFLGPYGGFGGPAGAGGLLGGGVYRDWLSPAVGVVGVQAEGYVGRSARGGPVDGRLLLGMRSPAARLGMGLELDLPHGQVAPFLSIMHPVRRGGLLLPGSLLHLTWIFGGADRVRVGLAVPVGQPLVGRGRPRSDHVDLARSAAGSAASGEAVGDEPGAVGPIAPVRPISGDPLAGAVADLVERVRAVNDVVVPFVGRSATRQRDDRDVADSLRALAAWLAPMGAQPVPALFAQYHAALDRAFSVALDPRATGATPQGRAMAAAARSVLLGTVILPWDRLLGQKRQPATLAVFAPAAQYAFSARTGGSLASASPRGRASGRAAWVLAEVLAAMDRVVAGQTRRWGDVRLVWLPLQLALQPNQYETQPQIDSLIARASDGEFSDSNRVAYIRSEQFQWQIYRSIHDARSYHVLWVHDFRGVNERGVPDGVAYRQVAFGYLDALIQRVRAYDATGMLPEFHMFLDQYFFESDRSRLWMPMLGDPLTRSLRLHGAPPAWQKTLDSLQTQLRSAVKASSRLQAEARGLGSRGDAWLRDRISVHVHVTQQADPSFWSHDILPLVGLGDNALRDHRKLIFYDLTEGDPYRGQLIVTGMGIGENFSSPEWEDRAVLLQGPAALVVKREAAALLLAQGVKPENLPAGLRPSAAPVAAADRAPVPPFGRVPARVMQIHNEVGYGMKRITVAKAVLYSLLPPGTVAKIPDSLWNNPLWASLLLGQALRGGQVLVMAPSLKNAPAPGAPEMSVAEMTLSRLIVAAQVLGPTITGAGGLLRVGIYDMATPVDDLPARIDSALANRQRTPWLRSLDRFAPSVEDSLRAVSAELRASGFHSVQTEEGAKPGAPQPAEDRSPDGARGVGGSHTATPGGHPKLHMKAQLFASGDDWDALFRDPAWGAILADYYRGRAQLIRTRAKLSEFYRLTPEGQLADLGPRAPAPARSTAATGGLAFRDQVGAGKPTGAVYYLLLGSHNEDYRSALLDGESVLLLSHFSAAVGIDDFVLLPSLCIWVDTPAELHRYLPARGSTIQRFARWARIML